MRSSERQLLAELATDVDAGFPMLVAWTQNELYSGLRGMCRNDADAADATQETLVRAFRALRGYDPDRIKQLKLRGWMWTIALNVVRNVARARSRRPAEVALVPQAHAPVHASAENEADLGASLWVARLAQLPEAQRTAVVLRHVADLPYKEIAAATDRPIGTIKTDVHRGIAALREIIDREEQP